MTDIISEPDQIIHHDRLVPAKPSGRRPIEDRDQLRKQMACRVKPETIKFLEEAKGDSSMGKLLDSIVERIKVVGLT